MLTSQVWLGGDLLCGSKLCRLFDTVKLFSNTKGVFFDLGEALKQFTSVSY